MAISALASREDAGRAIYVRILTGALVLTGLLVFAHAAVALWAEHEFTQPESIVAGQTRQFASEGTLYYGLKDYPYTVCAYMPLFYTAAAGLNRLGIPVLTAGRAISIAAVAAILWLVWSIVLLYTRDRHCAATALALAAGTHLLSWWGTVGQTDTVAIAFSLGALYRFAVGQAPGLRRSPRPPLVQAALLALAGLLTKQTVIAVPATIFVLLALRNRKDAALFAAIVGGAGGAIVLALDTALEGRFLANTLFANINPFAWYKVTQHFDYARAIWLPLAIVVAAGAHKAIRGPLAAPFVHLGFAAAIFAATCGKVGSDTNYQLETTLALVICAALSLHALDFFTLQFRGSKHWVTLLLIPLGLHIALNLRSGATALVGRIGQQRQFEQQTARVKPYLAGQGAVLSADMNALLQARQPIVVEPLIYRLLVEAGRIDGAPLLHDLETGAFRTIVLYDDVTQPTRPDPEVPRLTAEQTEAIRRRYRLVRHVPGPYLNGVYIYEPQKEPAKEQAAL